MKINSVAAIRRQAQRSSAGLRLHELAVGRRCNAFSITVIGKDLRSPIRCTDKFSAPIDSTRARTICSKRVGSSAVRLDDLGHGFHARTPFCKRKNPSVNGWGKKKPGRKGPGKN